MFEQIILILMAILFLVVLPLISTVKYWNFKPYMKYILSLIWVSYLVIAYEIFFPRDSYYINHLRNVSGIQFTSDIKIEKSYTSFLNTKAQYHSCALFSVSQNDKLLLNKLKKVEYNETLTTLDSQCMQMINPIFKGKNYISSKNIDDKHFRQWGYLKDSNKVFVIYQFFGMANK